MARSVNGTLGPMEVRPLDHGRSTTVNEIHHDDEQQWTQLVPRALGRIGMLHKTAAATIGIDSGLLSAQLSCAPNKHLSFRRMLALGREFWAEMVLLIIEFYGLPVGTLSETDKRDLAYGREMREAWERRMTR